MVHEGTRELRVRDDNLMLLSPFKDLGLGGGEGEKTKPRPRLSLQHPPHDLVLYTADIQDHLWGRGMGLKYGKEEAGETLNGISQVQDNERRGNGHQEKQRNSMEDEEDPKFEKE